MAWKDQRQASMGNDGVSSHSFCLSFSEQEQKTNGGYENAFQNTDIDKLEPRAQY